MDANYEKYTPEVLKAQILADLAGTVETREGSYANTLVSPAAYQLYKIYQLMPTILLMAFPDATAGEYIDRRAADFGLKRVPGQKARVTLRFTATSLTGMPQVAAGTVCATADGLRFVTLAPAVFSDGTAQVLAEAEEIGRAYNVEKDTVVKMAVNQSGIAAVTNPAAATGGADTESDKAFLQRYIDHLQRPISSGNKNHYRAWALETTGVSHAAVVPLWAGPGTVKVIVGGPDKEPLDSSIVSACAAHIEEERPIGAGVTVVSVKAKTIDISATVTLIPGHTVQEVAAELTQSLGALLATMTFGQENLLRYSRALALLLDCAGVEEYHTFTLNSATANVTAASEETPTVGKVVITERRG